MQLPASLAELPDTVELSRNGVPFSAQRMELATTLSTGGVLFADAGSEDSFTPVPFVHGPATLHAYVWTHPHRGPINVAVVVRTEGPRSQPGALREIKIRQCYARHIDGIPVDGGEISITLCGKSTRVESGFGDGAFPVYGRNRFLRRNDVLIVDFLVWKVKKVILRDGWVFDQWHVGVKE